MIEMKPVTSAAMTHWGYDSATRTLGVTFKSGRVHHWQDVPQETADAFEAHPSKGRAISEVLGAGGFASAAVIEPEQQTDDAPA